MDRMYLINEIEKQFGNLYSKDYRYSIYCIMADVLSIADLKALLDYMKELE